MTDAPDMNALLRVGRIPPALPSKDTEPEAKRPAVGAVVGLPEAVADRLRGDTVDDLIADARTLLAAAEGSEGPVPVPDFDAGPRASVPSPEPTFSQHLRAAMRAHRRESLPEDYVE